MSESIDSFDGLPETIRAGLRDLGWEKPTRVQARVLPAMQSGRDLIVQARTGSGKTGAFGIPIALAGDPQLSETQAMVLAPTRELAQQVAGEVRAIGQHCGLRCLPIYGGVGYGAQIEGMKAGAHVVVGTPGRVLDHLSAGRLRLDRVRTLVLDEADELLSLGFWPDMREIHSFLPAQRQSCLFSATMPAKVRSLARVFLREPEFVSLSEGHVAPQEIEHFFCVVPAKEKEAALARILESEAPDSAIIFCNTKDDVRYVTSYLQRRGFDADQISGDLAQNQREEVMARIKRGQLKFLVATDVAARGIDISDLSHVVSYTAPDSPEVYVHRTGRTGRAGKTGTAISLVSGLDIANFKALQTVNHIVVTEMKLPAEEDLLALRRERIAVKVEHEMRELAPAEREWRVDRFVPIVEALAASEEGRRDLAAIVSAYLREHRPETSVTVGAVPSTGSGARNSTSDAPRADKPAGGERGGRNRRRGGRGRRS